MFKIVLFVILSFAILTGCKSNGLSRSETESILKVFWVHKDELKVAKEKKLFTDEYIKSMDARDNEAEALLLKGAGYGKKK